ncbi:urea amidolyase associated protein UAAP2 [Bryobacter aggregatus]|uniref:urea amidolyase associated protein UAAP2 n=1 Tax=Bryobacter aggregatus TaxID=360054 RepID=UPI0004E285A9|nr:urea amidolyase associated protein UAAP2 [Bryobacter aggregatus]
MSERTLIKSKLDAATAIHDEVLPAGEGWIHAVKKGETFRIVDLDGNQAADTLIYNLHDFSERYSALDTINSQGNIYLTTGSSLVSNLGNELMRITADTCGRHDTLGGACAAESNQVRYAIEKRYMHNCRASFMAALMSWGHEKRDITSNINFFMNVPVTPEGKLTFEDGISEAGKYVEMVATMDVAVVISNCPQLNNPCNAYNPTPVRLLIWGAHVS